MTEQIGELVAPTRLMMTPGPCSIDPRVYRALSTPLVGHMDPFFIGLIGEVQTLLRQVFQTENRTTFPISASGSGGIECAMVNALEPGDEAIVCINGTFSERMAIIAARTGATIHRVEAPLGCTVDLADVTYYVGHETVIGRDDGMGMPGWQERFFAVMERNAVHVSDFFSLPNDQVVEIGRQVAI